MSATLDPATARFCAQTARIVAAIQTEIAQVERAVSTLPAPLPQEAVTALQGIDSAQQRLADLTLVFELISAGQTEISALADVAKLADTRAILGGYDTAPKGPPGDMELF